MAEPSSHIPAWLKVGNEAENKARQGGMPSHAEAQDAHMSSRQPFTFPSTGNTSGGRHKAVASPDEDGQRGARQPFSFRSPTFTFHSESPQGAERMRQFSGAEPSGILYMCTGNICRSASARVIHTNLLNSGQAHVPTASAGTFALEGNPLDADIDAALRAYPVKDFQHTARQANGRLLSAAQIIAVFGPEHESWVASEAPALLSRVVPFGKLRRAFEACQLTGKPLTLESLLGVAQGMHTKNTDYLVDPYKHGILAARECVARIYEDLTVVLPNLNA